MSEFLGSDSGINMIEPFIAGPSFVGKWYHHYSVMKADNLRLNFLLSLLLHLWTINR